MSRATVALSRTLERRTSDLSARISAAAKALTGWPVPFVVVADGRDDGGNFLRRKVHSVQNPERHHRAALAVIDPIHNVADIVEISGDFHQLHGSLRIAQRFQNPSGRLSDRVTCWKLCSVNPRAFSDASA